jgi:hypothetical protein
MLTAASVLVTVVLWITLAASIVRYWISSKRTASLRAHIAKLQADHQARVEEDAGRHAVEVDEWQKKLDNYHLSLFSELQAKYQPPVTPKQLSSSHHGLDIRRAKWCGSDPSRSVDKTSLIRSQIDGNAINYYVHESVLGNPFGSEAKRLEVAYTVDGKDLEQSVPNGGWLTLVSAEKKPREFDPGTSDGLANMLSLIPEKVQVDIEASQGDTEAWNFACAIMYSFEKAGWKVRGVINGTRNHVSGVLMVAQIDRWKYMEDARGNAIELAFRRIGVKINLNGRGDLTEDRIEIFVGANL